ncbi:MAG: cytochrome c biogenesis protein CcsA [Methanosarcinaceae archaeon]|nr:cytochrome c biogenesis protein CcsA [Methanosarcinaceae archaeon]
MAQTGDYLLFGSFLLSVVTLLDIIFRNKYPVKSSLDLSHIRFLNEQHRTVNLLYLIVSLLTLSIVLLVYYFIVGDFSVYYVWSYSNLATPLLYRISGLWSGSEGTFLLWTWLTYGLLLFAIKKQSLNDKFIKRASAIGLLVGIFFLILSINSSPFMSVYGLDYSAAGIDIPGGDEFGYYYLDIDISDGSGLDPILDNFWMAIHPPLTFIAYALLTIPFAFAIAHMYEKDERWLELSVPWLRLSWIFFVIGIGFVGGLWTYEAGWGIWTWDPVQTASLLPPMVLTAILHAAARKNNNLFKKIMPPLTVAAFIFVLYATHITRSGTWGSIHEFTETMNNSMIFLVMCLICAITLYLMIYRHDSSISYNTEKKDSLYLFTIILLLILSLVSFIGLTLPMIVRILDPAGISISSDFYNRWSYPFVLLLFIALGACNLDGIVGKRKLGIITLLVGLLSFVLFVIQNITISVQSYFTYFLFRHALLLSLLPTMIFVSISVYIRARGNFKFKFNTKVNTRRVGVHLIHLGMVLALVGGVVSTQYQYSENIEFEINEIGVAKEMQSGSLVEVSDFYVGQSETGNWYQKATVDISKNGMSIGKRDALYLRDDVGGEYVISAVVRGVLNDVNIVFHGLYPKPNKPPSIPITITVVPFINLLWLGMAFIGFGALLVYRGSPKIR